MPHGSPDWWGNIPSETVHGGLDTGELAVRLGSIVTFDRQGNVVWMDNFEGGLGPWMWGGGGDNNAVYLDAGCTMYGSLAALLHPGEEDDGDSWVQRILPYPVLGGLGFEIAFVPETNLKRIALSLLLYDGSDKYLYEARYDHVNGQVQVQTPGPNYPVVGSPGVQAVSYHNHCVMKLVLDCLTGMYARVLFNNHVYDASAHAVYVDTDLVTKPCMAAKIKARNTGVFLIDIPVDYAIVTQNEPV